MKPTHVLILSALVAAPLAAQSIGDPLAPLSPEPEKEEPVAAQPAPAPSLKPPTVPVVVPKDWAGVLREIDLGDWEGARQGIATLPDGSLRAYALAALYTAKNSPKVSQQALIDLLAMAPELPQAAQLAKMASSRGDAIVPTYAFSRPLLNLGVAPRRTKTRPASGDTVADLLRGQLDPFVKIDDGPGAEAVLLEAMSTIQVPEARAEMLQRVAWIYYVSGRDEDARRLGEQGRAENSGDWAGQSAWISGLASWRLGDCASAYNAFSDAARLLRDWEFQSGAFFWAARSAQACRRPSLVRGLLQSAARSNETFYGILARETLGMDHRMARPQPPRDLARLEALPNIRRARELLAIGRRAQAEELVRHQAKIGNPADHAGLIRVAEKMNLAGAQFWLAHFGPAGARVEPSDRYPSPAWVPYNGWRVDPALAYAHIIQESNFRTDAVSAAGAVGLMQVRPGTAGDTARARGVSFSASALKDPLANIDYGQAFIELIRNASATQGQLPKVIAAYNAGPLPVAKWSINDRGDPLLWMESIPYWETRYYVPTVMRNMWVIQGLKGEPSPTLTALAQHKWPAFPSVRR